MVADVEVTEVRLQPIAAVAPTSVAMPALAWNTSQ